MTHTERTAQAISDYKSEDNALIGLCEYLAARCDELEQGQVITTEIFNDAIEDAASIANRNCMGYHVGDEIRELKR